MQISEDTMLRHGVFCFLGAGFAWMRKIGGGGVNKEGRGPTESGRKQLRADWEH